MSSGICRINSELLENCYTEDTDGSMCLRNESNGIIRNCINLSNVSTYYDSKELVGGIAAYNTGTIKSCINKGNIHGKNYVGGICVARTSEFDNIYGSVLNCANYGDITSSNCAFGVGEAKEVTNCINFGKVKGNGSNARGIGGSAYNCVNVGEVNNGSGYAVSYTNVKSQSYALSTSGISDYNNKTALIDKKDFNNQDSFRKLDFDSVWKIDENGINLQSLESKQIGMSIYALPSKTNYYLGESFDPSGLKIMKFNSFGNWELTDDYTVSGFKGTLGKNTITVKCGDFSEKFNVYVYEDITNSTITFDTGNIQYANGEEICPDISVVSPSGRILTNGRDYVITYKNNIAPGIASLHIEGIGYNVGSADTTFTIKQILTQADVWLNQSDYVTTGSQIIPDFSVYNCVGAKLTEGVDYNVTLSNNILPGRATLTITGIGYYEGTLSINYYIKPAQVSGIYKKSCSSNYITLSWAKQSGVDGYDVQKYDSKKKKWVTYKKVTGNSLKITKLSASTTYKFRIRSYKSGNFGAYSKTFKTSTLSNKSKNTNSAKSTTKSKNSPKKVSNVKATVYTHHSTKQFKVTWNKANKISGYQIEYYGRNGWKRLANINNPKKSGYVSNWSDWPIDLSNVKIRVRAYKTVKGKKYYSSWSNAKISRKSK